GRLYADAAALFEDAVEKGNQQFCRTYRLDGSDRSVLQEYYAGQARYRGS
ncbi:unnamed protein product, partial [marine sediment metagenome]